MPRQLTIGSHQLPGFLLHGARRLFWLVMLWFHVAAIRSTWGGLSVDAAGLDWGAGGVRLLALLASAIFFALKIADVSWLRLRPGWRPLVASLMVVALLHLNVVQRATDGDLDYSPTHLAVVLFVGTLIEADTLRRGLAGLAKRFVRAADAALVGVRSSIRFIRWLGLEALRPPRLLVVSGIITPRPPPIFPPCGFVVGS